MVEITKEMWELSDKIGEQIEELKAEFMQEIPVNEIFAQIRKAVNIPDLQLGYKITDMNGGYLDITSENIIKYGGIFQLAFSELYIKSFSGSCKWEDKEVFDRLWEDGDIEGLKSYKPRKENIKWWGDVNLTFKYLNGGTNGACIMTFQYDTTNGLTYSTERDTYKNNR